MLRPIPIAVGLTLLFTTSYAGAQTYSVTVSSGAFSSIASRGTKLTFASDDDAAAAFSPNVSFPFFGQNVTPSTQLYAGTNGILGIGSEIAANTNLAIPTPGSPDAFLAPFWDDLRVPADGGVYWVADATKLYVEWNNVSHYSATTDRFTFQLAITLATGVVEFSYGTRNAASTAWSGTIGLEDSLGSFGANLACGAATACVPSEVPSGMIVRFSPSGGSTLSPDLVLDWVEPITMMLTPGQQIQIGYNVINSGSASAPDSVIALYGGSSSNVTTQDTRLAVANLQSIAPSGSSSGDFTVTVPSSWNGTYYFAAFVDPSNAISEADEANNRVSMGAIQIGNGSTSGMLAISTSALPTAEGGASYSTRILASGGTPPYQFSLVGGAPAWLALDASGNLSGTAPRNAATHDVVVRVADAAGASAMRTLTLTVARAAGLRITTPENVTVLIGADVRHPLEVDGGREPYRWSLVSGTLLNGLSLDPSGFIVGKVMRVGTTTVTFGVSDADGMSDQAVVIVQASPYRSGNGGGASRGSGRDDGGCTCVGERGDRPIAAAMVAFLIALAFGRFVLSKKFTKC